MDPHCAGLDVHKGTVVACLRISRMASSARGPLVETTTTELLALSEWLAFEGCTHVVMKANGVYWKPVRTSSATAVCAGPGDAAHVENFAARPT